MTNDNAIGSIITLVLGVAIAVLILIFMGLFSGSVYQETQDDLALIGSAETQVNETFTASNITAVQLTYGNLLANPTITNISAEVASGNFTFNLTSGTILLVGGNPWNGTKLNATYTFRNTTIESIINRGIVKSFEAQEKTADYLPIMVLAVIIAIVLGVVLGYASFNKGNGGNVAL